MPPKVPPNVRLPKVVTVPVSVSPLTVPVPETLVTVPVPLWAVHADPSYTLSASIVVLKYAAPAIRGPPWLLVEGSEALAPKYLSSKSSNKSAVSEALEAAAVALEAALVALEAALVALEAALVALELAAEADDSAVDALELAETAAVAA